MHRGTSPTSMMPSPQTFAGCAAHVNRTCVLSTRTDICTHTKSLAHNDSFARQFMHIHAHIHASMHTTVYVFLETPVDSNRLRIQVYTMTNTTIHTHAHTYVCAYMYLHTKQTYMHAYMHTCIYICTRMYIICSAQMPNDQPYLTTLSTSPKALSTTSGWARSSRGRATSGSTS